MASKAPSITPSLPGHVAGFPDLCNLRDLGGIMAVDGRRVRPGLLFRSGALTGLDERQRSRVDELGLRLVFDLRAAGEAAGKEDYVPQGAEYVRVGGMYDEQGEEVDFSPAGIGRMAARIAQKGESFMRELYASMMFGNPALQGLVRRFAACQAPLLFHCTAGKDRTGVCAAVLLMSLGVPDEQIMRDFLLTNQYRADIINMDPRDLPPNLPADQRSRWAAINGVSAEDLEASFAAVDKRFPTREEYLAAEFGLDKARLQELRDHYLEAPPMRHTFADARP